MRFIQAFNKNKAAFILSGGAALCSGVSLILYIAAGTNKFNSELSGMAIVMFSLAFACGGAFFAAGALRGRAFEMLALAQYALGLYAFCEYIVTQLNLISNVLYGVMNPGSGDGNTFGAAMIVTVIVSLAAWVCALIAFILLHRAVNKEEKAARLSGGAAAQ